MKCFILLMVFEAVVTSSLVYGDNGCTGFNYDASSLEDDSDYQFDDGSAASSNSYNIGDDLRLKIRVGNDWELTVYWDAAKYEAQMPESGWNYKVQFTVNTTYQTPLGEKKFFTTSNETLTSNNHETFPLYNPSATYTITVLTTTKTNKCLGERIVVNDLPGREDAIIHFQLRLKFYTYWPCARKLERGKNKVLSRFNDEIIKALSEERFQNRFDISLDLSHFKLEDLNATCQQPNLAMFTGRIVAIGNSTNTQFISAMKSWVRTQPTLPIRHDSVVVDQNCPVYYTPSDEEYCIGSNVDDKEADETEDDQNSNNNSSGVHHGIGIALVVVGVVLLIIVLVVITLACGVSRKKMFARFSNLSFRNQSSISRRLRITNVLADIESIDSRNRSPDHASSERYQDSSHHSKGT